MSDFKAKRPWCCPQTSCKCLYIFGELFDYSERSPGDSFICFGKLKKEVIRQVDGVVHKNDLSTCNYVAGRGIFRYFENKDDWRALIDAYEKALELIGNAHAQ